MARKTNRYRATAGIKYSKPFPSWVTGAQFVIPFYPFRSFSRVFIGRSMRHLEARRNIRSRAFSLSLSLSLPWELNTVLAFCPIYRPLARIRGGGREYWKRWFRRGWRRRGGEVANNGREEKWDFSRQDLNLNHLWKKKKNIYNKRREILLETCDGKMTGLNLLWTTYRLFIIETREIFLPLRRKKGRRICIFDAIS